MNECNFWLDVKIVLLILCCVFAYVSHMVLRFPKDSMGVALCLAGYCLMMVIHWYIEAYIEKDNLFYECSSHEYPKLLKWQRIKFYSEVIIDDD